MEEFERHIAGGPIYFKGRGDTYNTRTPNQFQWDRLAEQPVRDMRDHWRGLIALRLGEAGSVFRVANPSADHIQWFTPEDAASLGYVVGDSVAVAVNIGLESSNVALTLSSGQWTLVSNGIRVDHENGVSGPHPLLDAGNHEISVPARRMLIWVRK
jgi:hypothetical protein